MTQRSVPPSTTAAHTVLDLASEARTTRDAVGWITSAYRSQLTTPDSLEMALHSRVRLKRRRLLEALLARVPDDTESPLEVEYHLRVERAHALPRARRQVRANLGGQRIRRDLDYDEFDTVVELDGRLGHDDPQHRFRDMDRDNETAVEGKCTLRYGAADVFGDPCRVARQVAGVLARAGWKGELRRCGPNCRTLG
jgi:very-short-patch-repair endonuclease